MTREKAITMAENLSAALKGLTGVSRGYRVCLFRPERTTVPRRAVGGPFPAEPHPKGTV